MSKGETKLNFSDEFMNVFKTFCTIGAQSPKGSFVLLKKDKMKVMHESATILAVYEYDELRLEKPIGAFDAIKLHNIIDIFRKKNSEYSFKFINDHHIVVKSGKSKFTLYLKDYKEISSRSELDMDEDDNVDISGFVVLSDSKYQEKIDSIEENKVAKFILTQDDIKKIEQFQKIMKVKDKLFSITRGEGDNIKFVISDDLIKENPDVSSFEISEGVEFNNLKAEDEYAVEISGRMSDIKTRDYEVTLSKDANMFLNSKNDKLKYILAGVYIGEEEEDDASNEDFDFDKK